MFSGVYVMGRCFILIFIKFSIIYAIYAIFYAIFLQTYFHNLIESYSTRNKRIVNPTKNFEISNIILSFIFIGDMLLRSVEIYKILYR